MESAWRTCGIITLILLVLVLPGSCQLNASVSRQFLEWEMFAPVDQIHHHDKYSVLCVSPHAWHGQTPMFLELQNCATSIARVVDSLIGGFYGFILPGDNMHGPIRTGSNPDLCWTVHPMGPDRNTKTVMLGYCTGGKEQDFIASYTYPGERAAVRLTWRPEMLNVHVGPRERWKIYNVLVSSRTQHWFTLRSEPLSWGSPVLAPALSLGSIIFSSVLLFAAVSHLLYTWVASGLRITALVKTLRLATHFRCFRRVAIDKESEQIHKLFVHLRIRHFQSAAYWSLYLLVMPTAALHVLREYSDGFVWRLAISAQADLQSTYILEGTLTFACLQYFVVFPTFITAKSLDCFNVFLSLTCIASTLVRGPSFSNSLDQFWTLLCFRIFYTIFCGNARLTLLLQIAITLVELTGVDFVPYGIWVFPQSADLPIALSILTAVVTLAWLVERQTLREATSLHHATVEKEIRERLLAVMVDGNLSVKRDERGIFRINALDASASQLLGLATDCSIVGESLDCLTPSWEQLEAVVTEAEETLDGPALLREIRFTTQYGQHITTKSYVVGTPSAVTIALLITDEFGIAVDSSMHMHVPNTWQQSENVSRMSSQSVVLRQTIDTGGSVFPKVLGASSCPAGEPCEVYGVCSSPAGDPREVEGSCPEQIVNGSDVISEKDDDAVTFRSMDAHSHRGGQMTARDDRIKKTHFRVALVALQEPASNTYARASDEHPAGHVHLS